VGAGQSRQARAGPLYGERGFDNTTVAEIAARAGLTHDWGEELGFVQSTFMACVANSRRARRAQTWVSWMWLSSGMLACCARVASSLDGPVDSFCPKVAVSGPVRNCFSRLFSGCVW
jgi:Bacterial regulatory proteins, tetR family